MLTTDSSSSRARNIRLFVLLGVLVLMIVQYARILASEISYSEAIQDRAFGGDTLWSVWKRMHGYAVYSDAWELPFSCSNYNYLFYDFYALMNVLIMKALHLGDEWMQVISSHVSLVLSLLGAWFFSRNARELIGKEATGANGGLGSVTLICASVAVLFGPMLEDLPTELRCDPGAFMLLMLAVLLIQRREKAPIRTAGSLAPVIILSYLSWAFRQSYVELPVAYVLYLAVGRRWKEIAVYSLGLWVLFGATFWFLRNTFYWQNCIFVPTLDEWKMTGVTMPFVHLALKAPESLAGLFIIAWSVLTRQKRSGASKLLLYLSVVSFVMNFMASAKPGAHSSYYLPFTAFAMLLLLEGVFAPQNEAEAPRRRQVFSAVFLGTFVMLGVASAYCIKSRRCDRREHYAAVALEASLEGLPRPVYVCDSWLLNEPWIVKTDTPIVRAWLHYTLEKKGRKLAYGGIDGLTKMGYFGTIAVPIQAGADDPQVALIAPLYDKVKADDYHTYWTRKSTVIPPKVDAPVFKWPASD